MKDTTRMIADHTAKLEQIYKQRRQWLYASSVVYTVIILTVFSWDYLTTHASEKVWWAAISLGLLVSVNWWYWTMKSIAELVRSMYAEYEILTTINIDINELKEIIRQEDRDR